MFSKMKALFKKKEKQGTSTEQTYSKFGIGYRLIAAFSIVTALTIIISGLGWFSFDVLTSAQNKTAGKDIPAITQALKLANDASEISALAPQLGLSNTAEDRKENLDRLNASIKRAQDRLEELKKYITDEDALSYIAQDLQALAPMVNTLDMNVSDRLRYAALRQERLKQLQEFRNILDKGVSSMLIPIRLKMFDTSDQWIETLEKSIETALKGTTPEYNVDPLTQNMTNAMTAQESVFRVQASGFLLVSLLAEGALAETPEDVENLSNAFLSSISSMATPLAKINSGETAKFAQKFEELFQSMLQIGTKGTEDEVIFQIRKNELSSIANSTDAMTQTRALAENLSIDVNSFVNSVEASVKAAAAENGKLAEQTKLMLLIAAAISVIIAIAIGWLYIARNLVKRLLMMVESARKLSEGDLESSIYREGNDEIARLGFAIVGFRDNAREAKAAREKEEEARVRREKEREEARVAEAEREREAQAEKERLAQVAEEEKRAEMQRLADEFEGSIKHLVESFSQATSVMTNISGSMTDSAGQTTALTQNVANASQLSSNSINSVAAAAEQLSSSISEISQQVGQAASVAGEAVSEAERSNIMITGLNEAAAKIGDVVSLISDIAEQTNLLALNATIEAARAGDAGKGFAVVASEVKNLATQTAKATEEITNQIKSVQTETGNAVDAIGSISTTIGRISEINTTISAAVEEQGAATTEISRSVQQAASSANEVTENINTVNETASKTGLSASEVQEVAKKLANEAGNLQGEVDRFLQQVRNG
ncbi:methyl-accepting chemotaxis protein [Sneathiella limimaris]|uniref:methyl-accepting chemotaxis protein n=1 Tax=Sneathiella limimaris TaxID=1964213 RepID=UPI00146A1351|nr:HAMP domain-containing methyl-accepting chemotaxis protein [Sneathiella limimaris]